jgi:hypothetical protein
MAMLSIGYNKYLLPLDKALLLFEALQSVEGIEEEWDSSTTKMNIKRKQGPEVVLKLVSAMQVATMVLGE